MNFSLIKKTDGTTRLVGTMSEEFGTAELKTLLRGFKQAFPNVYAEVYLEMEIPKANGVANRIVGANGND